MELIWNELEAERLIKKADAHFKVSGELPSPDGRAPSAVLSTKAKLCVESAEALQEEAVIKGKVIVSINAVDEEGRPFSFESSAEFEQSIKLDGACAGMSLKTYPTVTDVSASPSAGGAYFEADAEISLLVTSAVPMKVTGGVSGVPDLEIKRSVCEQRKEFLMGSADLRMREEIAADDISEVISCEGEITVRDAVLEQGAATVSGTLTVSAVTLGSGGHMSQLVRQIPFRERIELEDSCDEVFSRAELKSLYLRALGEEFALISLEAEVRFEVYGTKTICLDVPSDAFSPSIGFGCLYEDAMLLSSMGSSYSQTTIKESIPLPDNAPELSAPLFVSVTPVVTEAVPENGVILVNGILATSVTYESTAGNLRSFTEDVPFTAEIISDSRSDLPIVSAACIGSVSGTAERSVQVQYTLVLCADKYKRDSVRAVVGLAENERSETRSGIVICFASEGEEVFDVAKRCSVSCAKVKAMNPDAEPPFKEGEKLLLIV